MKALLEEVLFAAVLLGAIKLVEFLEERSDEAVRKRAFQRAVH